MRSLDRAVQAGNGGTEGEIPRRQQKSQPKTTELGERCKGDFTGNRRFGSKEGTNPPFISNRKLHSTTSQDGADGGGRRPLRCGSGGGVARRRRRLVAGGGDPRPAAAGAVLALGDLAVHGRDVAAAPGPRGLAARPALHLVAHALLSCLPEDYRPAR
jgi:hypothetical protein